MKLDAAILRRVERIAHAIQRRTGVTCYGMAHHAAAGGAVVGLFADWLKDGLQSPVSSVSVAAGWLLIAHRARKIDSAWAAQPDTMPREVARERTRFSAFFRCVVVLFGMLAWAATSVLAVAGIDPVGLSDLLIMACWGLIAAYAYLIASVPLPPGLIGSRERKKFWQLPRVLVPASAKGRS